MPEAMAKRREGEDVGRTEPTRGSDLTDHFRAGFKEGRFARLLFAHWNQGIVRGS
jgi:hypothetical protein